MNATNKNAQKVKRYRFGAADPEAGTKEAIPFDLMQHDEVVALRKKSSYLRLAD